MPEANYHAADSVAEVVIKDKIHTALNDYTLGMDLRNRGRFLGAWHEDAKWEVNSAVGGGPLSALGHGEIEAAARDLWAMEQLVLHLTGNHEIRIDDPTHAHGDCHATILGVTKEGRFFLNGAVYPDDQFELRDGVWRLTYRRVEINVYVELAEAAAAVQLFVGAGGAFGPGQ